MRLIHTSEYRRTPWQNGAGTTFEIAAEPLASTIDTFDWRISMAQVASAGPFSSFPGIDRSLAVLSGSGLILRLRDDDEVALGRTSPPLCFRGEWPVECRLLDGAVEDFNVMTRRSRCRHALTRMDIDGVQKITRLAPLGGLFLAAGRKLHVETEQRAAIDTGARELVLLESPDGSRFRLTSEGPASVLLIELTPISAQAEATAQSRRRP
jgi:environmental stress-induced protein Ves